MTLRLAFLGDGPWAQGALRSILAAPEFIVTSVTARAKNPDKRLLAMAHEAGLPVIAARNVNDTPFLEEMRAHRPDLIVSMSFDQIMRKPFLEAAPMGAINCHAGALPFYRGRNPLNWALINGEAEFGVTVHHVDEGIDTGDLIVQRLEPIAADDDYGALLAKAIALCPAVLLEALRRLATGTATRTPQSGRHPVGSYFSMRRVGDEWIDWGWSAERVVNFVRGIALPAPGARTMAPSGEIAILKAALVPQAPAYIATEGEVIGATARGVLVKTGTSFVEAVSIAPVMEDGSLGEPRQARFPIGTRFAPPPSPALAQLRAELAALGAAMARR